MKSMVKPNLTEKDLKNIETLANTGEPYLAYKLALTFKNTKSLCTSLQELAILEFNKSALSKLIKIKEDKFSKSIDLRRRKLQ